MANHLAKKKRSWDMSRIRSRDTAPEKIVRKTITKLGSRYRLHAKQLPGKPAIIKKRIKLQFLSMAVSGTSTRGAKEKQCQVVIGTTGSRNWKEMLRNKKPM